jgi:hypothetical protein
MTMSGQFGTEHCADIAHPYVQKTHWSSFSDVGLSGHGKVGRPWKDPSATPQVRYSKRTKVVTFVLFCWLFHCRFGVEQDCRSLLSTKSMRSCQA